LLGTVENPFPAVILSTELETMLMSKISHHLYQEVYYDFQSGHEFVAGSSDVSQNTGSSCRSDRACYNLLNEIIFAKYYSGFHTSIFRSDIQNLHSMMNMHGLQPQGLSLRDSRLMILHHLFSGFCSSSVLETSTPLYNGDRERSGCRYIAAAFPKTRDLLIFFSFGLRIHSG
jgi:hypothetical protein